MFMHLFYWKGRNVMRSIAQAKVHVLQCIMVAFECDARTSAKTVMPSNDINLKEYPMNS